MVSEVSEIGSSLYIRILFSIANMSVLEIFTAN